MMRTFYVIKWILRSLLFLLILDLIVESAVVAPNQKDNQDGTKLSEQRFLPETSPALYVEEENHAPKLNQISRKRVKRGLQQPALKQKSCVLNIKRRNCQINHSIRCSCSKVPLPHSCINCLNILNCPGIFQNKLQKCSGINTNRRQQILTCSTCTF